MNTAIDKEGRVEQHTLESLNAKLDLLLARQERQQELIDEMMPIVHDAMGVATQKLLSLEERGYFRFGAEAMAAVDRVVTSLEPDDLRALSDNVAAVLETVRSAEPAGVYGVVRAMREEDVRTGVGVMLALLRGMGKQVRRRGRGTALVVRQPRPLSAMLAPRRRRESVVPARKSSGIATGQECVVVDPAQWTREIGQATAQAAGISPMTQAHWALVDFARADFEATDASPNVRRIARGADVGTKEVYRLFPKAPGRTIAKIAGIPKPGGCL